jgi:hypothetical protein
MAGKESPMATRPDLVLDASSPDVPRSSSVYQDGIVAGVLGAATVALWFLVLDTLAGRPLYTPTVLGTALFRRGAGLDAPELLPVSLEMVGMFTWVHALVFVLLGGLASRLLVLAERNPSYGFGVLLLFVVFQAGFTTAAVLVAAPVIRALGWLPILVANMLAAAAMAGYLGWRHRGLRVNP